MAPAIHFVFLDAIASLLYPSQSKFQYVIPIPYPYVLCTICKS